jgi:hypothetical protein
MSKIDELERAEEEAEKARKEIYGEADTAVTEEETPEGETNKPPEEPPEETRPVVSEETWEQKYRTLHGKYQAELPIALAEVKKWKADAMALDERVRELEGKLSKISIDSSSSELDKDIEKYSLDYPDLGKIIKKITDQANARIQELEKKLSNRVQTEVEPVKEDLIKTKADTFDRDMIRLGVPNWKAIDNDPKFATWLKQAPIYGRFTREEMLTDAARAFDAVSASEIFLDFIKSNTPPEEPDTQAKLKNLTAPPRNESTSRARPSGGAVLTRAMYVDFMKQSSMGRFNPNDWGGKTEAQVEAMFDAVIAKGELK